jgi:uncharacterized cupin superfamily protein
MSSKPYVLKASDISAMDATPKNHAMNPNAQCMNRSLSEATGMTGLGFHIIEVQPERDSTEFHMHYNEDECVYILEGTGTAQVGDDIFEVGAGDFLGYRKGGLAHTIKNTGSTVLKCIVAGQRLESDVVDYPNAGKRIYRTTGLPWKVVDFADTQDRPVAKPK